MSDTVLLEKRGRVALLTLNRPDRANTMNGELIGALQHRDKFFYGVQALPARPVA